MNFHRGTTSEQRPDPVAVFATWRLADSLPCRSEYLQSTLSLSEGQRFLAVDRLMDQALTGPVWLENPFVAESIAQTLLAADRQWNLCSLLAWVIMPNHVHILMRPNRPLPEVARAIRRNGARLANEILGRPGCTLWHEGSYDYWVRDDAELQRIASYIESNPVTAGLAARREQWHWSSAFPQLRAEAGRMMEIECGLLAGTKSEIGPILAA
jgi:REP element-mobilizing transposase RayT